MPKKLVQRKFGRIPHEREYPEIKYIGSWWGPDLGHDHKMVWHDYYDMIDKEICSICLGKGGVGYTDCYPGAIGFWRTCAWCKGTGRKDGKDQ